MATVSTIQEHPLYIENSVKYQEYQDFYLGGVAVEKNLAYLPQHPYESDAQYEIRKTLSTYKNLCKPIVSVFSSSIWRRQPVRTLPASLETYLDDVNGIKEGADTVFQELSTHIAAYGLYFVLVDSTRTLEQTDIISKKDASDYGIRPVFVPVSPLDLIAWGHDSSNKDLLFVVIRESIIRNSTGDAWGEYTTVEQYKIWYQDRWELWEIRNDSETIQGFKRQPNISGRNSSITGQNSGLVKVAEGVHPCGQVPIVAGYFKKKYEMVGESCFAEILSLIKRSYILENTLDKSLFDTAFPQQGFYGFDSEDVKNYIRSSSNGLVASDPSARSEYIEPSGRAFQALTDKILSDEKAIREISLRMVRPDTKQVESAESKKLDKQQLDSQLSVFSKNCEDFERRCWQMFGKWLEIGDSEIENITVKYNDDFDIEKISSDLLKAFAEMRKTGDLSRQTYWQILKDGEIPLPEDFDEVEEVARIEADNRSTTSFGQAGRTFLTGTGTKI